MKIGFVGLGKMGNQIVAKLLRDTHEVVVYDVDTVAVAACQKLGASPASSREDLVDQLGDTPIIWLMIPAQYVGPEVNAYAGLLPAGSVLIDGGNSNFHETMRRGKELMARSIAYVDVGTSGGIMGLENGFCMMVGGDNDTIARLSPILNTMAAPFGKWIHAGELASGHYVKMIHNGIEYALMQSYAEGYDLIKYGEMPGINLAAVADVWQHGSIIESKLNQLIAELLHENPELEGIDGYVADSGEGRWTYEAAEASQVQMPALREALAVRKASQEGHYIYATKLLAGLRNKFGGHAINHPEEGPTHG
ncbi:MAG: NADP-dependent phosphogluconate dehydrogenase [Candidatus Saccharimonas sp.]|nr:NADP-dependent phosphogluconate dehydrogenase [Candidatus Saccharimonas sp.]